MIPQAHILEWSKSAPWKSNEQIEQDLVISRAITAIYSDEWLSEELAFRGGTALHKLCFSSSPRYSEDIDLVQIHSAPIKEYVQRLQSVLSFLGESAAKPKKDGIQLFFRFQSETLPITPLRLKVEINTREHFTVMGYEKIKYKVNSSWFSGNSNITTFRKEELLGTKLRALYQRKKGRDLFDIYYAFSEESEINPDAILQCYREYIKRSVSRPPSRKEFIINMNSKIHDTEFLGDTTALLGAEINYDPVKAYALVKSELIEKI